MKSNLPKGFLAILLFIGFTRLMNADSLTNDPRLDRILSRPVPEWWQEARFGIFIHWGPYSVPAFAENDYSEWYWAHAQGKEGTKAFHHSVYGKDFTYSDFFPYFKAELFDPEEWASLFKRSGARYVVLTTKHNDGYCLWPNEHASDSRGQPWNSVVTGPRRDLVKDLTEAVEQEGLKMGLYFLLYEWGNPIYQQDPQQFFREVSIPQIKELVAEYNPWILWTDGGWQHDAEEYHSLEILDWVLDETGRGDDFVFNERWGEPLEGSAGHLTTEYTYAVSAHKFSSPWEETRGMGTSFAYNRVEKLEDYATADELILTLVDVVSYGGNLLLDVGPRADGIIPLFMQERLLKIGAWLDLNGEAIYGSNPWKHACQWTDGQNPLDGFEEEMSAIKDGIAQRLEILRRFDIKNLTLEPEEGYARKEWIFTQNDDFVYAIYPGVPSGQLTIRDLSIGEESKISLIGFPDEIKWEQTGSDLQLSVPAGVAKEVGFYPAYVFKIPKQK